MSLRIASSILRSNLKVRSVPCAFYGKGDSHYSDPGSGSGKGGGSGGKIRESGGVFGKKEASEEERYFYELQKKQIDKLKKTVMDEIKYHKEQIEEHQEAIDRHKKKIEELTHIQKHT